MRLTVLMAVLGALALAAAAQTPAPRVLRLGVNEYRLYETAARRITAEEVRRLDDAFNHAAATLAARLNVYRPPTATVIIAAEAGLFYRLTGADWRTAGVYDAGRDTYVFQHPRSLTRLRSLDGVVAHEVCHGLVRSAMPPGDGEATRWLEESLCEALAPGGESRGAGPAAAMAGITDAGALAAHLNTGLRSCDAAVQARAHALARAWGRFLVRRHGEAALMALMARRRAVDWDADCRAFRAALAGTGD